MHIQSIMDSINKSVPFSNSDILDMQEQQQVNPHITINDVIKAKNKNQSHPDDITNLLNKYGDK